MIQKIAITSNFKADNLFLVKIKANSLCYGEFEFCKTFSQSDENGKITAYINVLSGNSTAYLFDDANVDEIRQFLALYNVKNVFCNEDLGGMQKGVVLKYNLYEKHENDLKVCNYPDYKFVYSLLENEFFMPDYNEFVSDLSYRIKNGFARLIENKNGVVFTLWETKNQAVISAIAVKKEYRGNGEGSGLLKSIIASLNNKEVYIYCEQKTESFYIKNGFLRAGEYFSGKAK